MDLTFLFPHLGPALLVLARLSGLFLYAPVFASSAIPAQIKAFALLTLSVATYLGAMPILAAQGQIPFELTLWNLVPMMIVEVLVGVVIGFLATLPMIALQISGQAVGQQVGFGMARSFNPAMESETNLIGQLLFFLALMLFISLRGLEIVLGTLMDTFNHIPLGGYRVDWDLLALVNGLIMSAMELAVRIAAPVLCLIFLQTFALGFVNKTAQAFNIMSLGFPLRVMVGLGVLVASIGVIDQIVGDEWIHMFEEMQFYFANYVRP